jgi:hypothetical protein
LYLENSRYSIKTIPELDVGGQDAWKKIELEYLLQSDDIL